MHEMCSQSPRYQTPASRQLRWLPVGIKELGSAECPAADRFGEDHVRSTHFGVLILRRSMETIVERTGEPSYTLTWEATEQVARQAG